MKHPVGFIIGVLIFLANVVMLCVNADAGNISGIILNTAGLICGLIVIDQTTK